MLDPNTIPNRAHKSGRKNRHDYVYTDSLDTDIDSKEPSVVNDGDRSDLRTTVDAKEFDAIFRGHNSELICHAARIVGSSQIAEDIVHEVFTKTYRLISEGKEINQKKIGGWLFRCVHNEALNILRKRKRVQYVPIEDDDNEFIENYDISEYLSYEDRSMKILATVSDLPRKQRKAFLLFDMHGLNYKETAAAMDISTNSVRQLLFRARRNIRQAVGSETAGMAAPVLRSELFHGTGKTSISDLIAQQVAKITARYLSYFNYLGERIASISTTTIAVILFGVAIAVIGQSRNGEVASGAVLDPTQLMQSIRSDPVGKENLLTDRFPIPAKRVMNTRNPVINLKPGEKYDKGHQEIRTPRPGDLANVNDSHKVSVIKLIGSKERHEERRYRRSVIVDHVKDNVLQRHGRKIDYRHYKLRKHKAKVESRNLDTSGRDGGSHKGGSRVVDNGRPSLPGMNGENTKSPRVDKDPGSDTVTKPDEALGPESSRHTRSKSDAPKSSGRDGDSIAATDSRTTSTPPRGIGHVAAILHG